MNKLLVWFCVNGMDLLWWDFALPVDLTFPITADLLFYECYYFLPLDVSIWLDQPYGAMTVGRMLTSQSDLGKNKQIP